PLPKSQQTNLIINYLPNDILEEELFDMFSTFGFIRSLKIIRDSSGRCAGYGFVDFESSRCAHVAQVLLNGRELREKRLKVAFALPRGSDIAKCNLFVRYLPVKVTEEELENLFGDYGRTWSVKILRHKLNELKYPQLNAAYVRFRQPADAEKAVIALNGYCFPGAMQPISVQTAKSLKRNDSKEDEDQDKYKEHWNHSPP
ncbi:hypothetical protein KR054_006571, partial [Drosophila jambulina]